SSDSIESMCAWVSPDLSAHRTLWCGRCVHTGEESIMAAPLGISIWAATALVEPIEDREELLWVARARTGDESAYRWLLDRYRARAVRLAAHVLRRPDDAEDVAQEAFIRAFRNLGGFRGDG